jgi:PKD domain-containing protein
MRNHSFRAAHGRAALAAAMVLALNGCGLDKVEIPELDGPAELGLSLKLTASPDIVTADGFSSSLVQVQLRGPNGEGLPGRQVFMGVADSQGRTADIGQLRSTGSGGIGTGVVLTTGANGIAQASYEAPPRTDMTANASVIVQARPIDNDAQGQIYRTVRIELRSAEPRLFPQVPGNTISCNFLVEPGAGPYRVNTVISLQSLASSPNGPIVRYEWFFGDGTRDDKPNIAKVFRFPGNYQVLHVVTDAIGGTQACSVAGGVTVIP